MFAENKKNGAEGSPLLAIFGTDACLEGKFTIGDSIQIECKIVGEMNVEGTMVIGEKGNVRADVNTVDAIIRGQYQGDMVATGVVEIAESGRVTGNIETDSLVITKGGFFNGGVSKIRQSAGKTGKTGKVGKAEERHSAPALVDTHTVEKKAPFTKQP